jgi:hypothetical protein
VSLNNAGQTGAHSSYSSHSVSLNNAGPGGHPSHRVSLCNAGPGGTLLTPLRFAEPRVAEAASSAVFIAMGIGLFQVIDQLPLLPEICSNIYN